MFEVYFHAFKIRWKVTKNSESGSQNTQQKISKMLCCQHNCEAAHGAHANLTSSEKHLKCLPIT